MGYYCVKDITKTDIYYNKGKDKLTVEYALRNVNKPIGISSYEIVKFLPKDFQDKLPTEDDLNLHIDIKEI